MSPGEGFFVPKSRGGPDLDRYSLRMNPLTGHRNLWFDERLNLGECRVFLDVVDKINTHHSSGQVTEVDSSGEPE